MFSNSESHSSESEESEVMSVPNFEVISFGPAFSKGKRKKNVSLYLKVYTNLFWVIWKGSDQWEQFQTSLNNFKQVSSTLYKFGQSFTNPDKFRKVWEN